MNRNLICVSVSKDSKYALVNVRPEEIHLWDLMTIRKKVCWTVAEGVYNPIVFWWCI